MAKVALLFANGTEEVEALSVVDIVRRAGIDLKIVSVTGKREATSSHDVTIIADETIEEHDFGADDMIVLPGGMPGTNNLEEHPLVQKALKEANEAGKYLAAICAAPKVLAHAGFLEGKKAGIFPGMEDELKGANVSFDEVSVDGRYITSRGLGTAIPFGLTIVEILTSSETAEELAKKVVYKQSENPRF